MSLGGGGAVGTRGPLFIFNFFPPVFKRNTAVKHNAASTDSAIEVLFFMRKETTTYRFPGEEDGQAEGQKYPNVPHYSSLIIQASLVVASSAAGSGGGVVGGITSQSVESLLGLCL